MQDPTHVTEILRCHRPSWCPNCFAQVDRNKPKFRHLLHSALETLSLQSHFDLKAELRKVMLATFFWQSSFSEEIRNCPSPRLTNPQLLPSSDRLPGAVLWAETVPADKHFSQPIQCLATGTLKHEQGHSLDTLPTTQHVFNCLEYNHLFIFTVMTEECTGVFTHRYKNLFIYRVTIIFNWEIILFS